MGKTNQTKVEGQIDISRPLRKAFKANIRLNLNELLKKRQKEKTVDSKTNLAILTGTTTVAVIVLAILSL